MQCYQHHDRAAVGVCRGCGKGVCAEGCAEDLGFGLSCSNDCSIRLGHVEALNHKAGAAYSAGRRYLWLGPTLAAVLAAMFLYLGWIEYRNAREYWFPAAFGLLLSLTAIVLFVRNRNWSRAIR
ncbi:DUF2180 family protein [Luteimonas aquatica]|uniref:DUF2180 family protein n=1 Tax=Luteimonas aquatica TaxID=450364 RepID=UPI001F55FC67|nr:DUF2180 family protein [Luteimonas aquatica]